MSSVDVIVPCYGYGHFLRQCVESVLDQTGPTVRVLIIDDASPDNTAAVATDLVKEDSRVTFLRHRKNAGHIATYNEGIEWVSAKYMLLLSADDYLLPGAFSRAAALMDAHPEAGFVFGNVIELSDNGTTRQLRVLPSVPGKTEWRIFGGLEFVELSGGSNIVKTPTAVVRTELQKQVGGYRPELTHSGDMEMWLRLAGRASAGFVEACQAVYRRHGDCMSHAYSGKNSLRDVQQRKAAFDCFFENSGRNLPNAQELRRRLFRSLGCDALGFASAAFNDGELDACEALSKVAFCIAPGVGMSWPGIKLACKRRIGRRVWAASQRAVAGCADWRSNVLLRMQRCNIRLPEVLRGRLRSLVLRLSKYEITQQGVEGWSTPLIAGHGVAAEQLARADGVLPTSAEPQVPALRPNDNDSEQEPAMSGVTAPALRCLLVTSSLDVGGMEEVVVFLARRLRRHGVHTAVLHASPMGTPNGAPSGRLGRMLIAHGIETVELAGAAGARWIEAWRPDVVSVHDVPSWVIEATASLSIPCVETLHGMHSLFSSDRVAVAERGRRLAGIVAVSDLVRRQYLDINPDFPPKRIVTIPNGVDDWRRVHGDRERNRARMGIQDEYVFVSLARHCLQKNTYGLVAAFADVAARHPEAHLVIAGRPDDAAYFAQVVRLRGLVACRERIHLRDHNPNPAELLALADGFVLDSFFEGWSLASMEALYAGVPVVLSEVGGASEQVGADGERGYLIPNPVGDPLRVNWETIRETRFARQVNRDALVKAMSSLVTNRASWLAGRQRLMSESAVRFDPEICLRSHAQVLAAAAKPNGRLRKGVILGEPG